MWRCNCLFKWNHAELYFKYLSFQQLVVNALLQSCESCSRTEYWFNRIYSFLHRSICSKFLESTCVTLAAKIKSPTLMSGTSFRTYPIRDDLLQHALSVCWKTQKGIKQWRKTIPSELLSSCVDNNNNNKILSKVDNAWPTNGHCWSTWNHSMVKTYWGHDW